MVGSKVKRCAEPNIKKTKYKESIARIVKKYVERTVKGKGIRNAGRVLCPEAGSP